MIRRFRHTTALLFLSPAFAVASDVSYWTHSSATDYSQAVKENVVVTNYGDVQLTRQLQTLAEGIEGVSVVYSLAQGPDGAVYAGTGPTGVLLRIEGENVQRFVLPGTTNLFAVAFDAGGKLLVGAGGENGKLLRIEFDGENVNSQAVFEAEGVSYIWRIGRHEDGTVYVATGPTAALYEIRPGAEPREIFKAAGEKNLLSLALTAGDVMYLGTDPNGLIWQVNRKTGESRVLFDAAEPEITSLVVSGNTLFATGAARSEEMEQAEEPGAGMPDVLGPAARIDRPDVELPEEPDLPPPEPDRIPLGMQQEVPGQEQPPQPDPEQPIPGGQDEEGPEMGFDEEEPGGMGPPVADFAGTGSAVYRLDLAEGKPPRVTGVLRDSALFLDLVAQNGRLLLAAGAGEGETSRVLQLDAATSELALLAEPDARQIAAMLPLSDGRVLLGLANPGGVATLGATFAAEGTLTSPALDAGAVSTFGMLQLTGRLPEGTQLLISTRSGNTADPQRDAAGWSAWSEPAEARRFVPTGAAPGRFLQYRLTFRSNGATTPSVEKVRIAYMQPNLPPQVASLQVNSELDGREVSEVVQSVLDSGEAPSALRGIEWEAADPNGDPLIYDLFIRKGGRGEFVLLAADLTEAAYAWDAKASGDGTYEFRVVAKDARGNAKGAGLTGARVSEAIEVDLTPPRIGDVETRRAGEAATVSLRIADGQGIVARLEYLLSGDPADASNWIRAFPADGMADSPQEQYVLELDSAAPGGTVRLRAVDDAGNISYQTVTLPAR